MPPGIFKEAATQQGHPAGGGPHPAIAEIAAHFQFQAGQTHFAFETGQGLGIGDFRERGITLILPPAGTVHFVAGNRLGAEAIADICAQFHFAKTLLQQVIGAIIIHIGTVLESGLNPKERFVRLQMIFHQHIRRQRTAQLNPLHAELIFLATAQAVGCGERQFRLLGQQPLLEKLGPKTDRRGRDRIESALAVVGHQHIISFLHQLGFIHIRHQPGKAAAEQLERQIGDGAGQGHQCLPGAVTAVRTVSGDRAVLFRLRELCRNRLIPGLERRQEGHSGQQAQNRRQAQHQTAGVR